VQWPHGGWSNWLPAKADTFYTLSPQGLLNWKAP
jgi:hypothetical protein